MRYTATAVQGNQGLRTQLPYVQKVLHTYSAPLQGMGEDGQVAVVDRTEPTYPLALTQLPNATVFRHICTYTHTCIEYAHIPHSTWEVVLNDNHNFSGHHVPNTCLILHYTFSGAHEATRRNVMLRGAALSIGAIRNHQCCHYWDACLMCAYKMSCFHMTFDTIHKQIATWIETNTYCDNKTSKLSICLFQSHATVVANVNTQSHRSRKNLHVCVLYIPVV